MNTLEVSRQRAEQLHTDAVASGGDPTKPYEFARAEVARRRLDVERLPKGDGRLHGGRAVYDPDALLILHEDSGDAFIDAFLIAHEIGHVELGGRDEPSTTTEIDPYRASEAAPVGVDRVADYSRRQRREVQMDLFAREFLLPRSWLRTLHLAGRASASEIATQLGAPHAVVAQQLLDALLLPVAPQPEAEVSNKPLLPDQASAASHEGSPFLLEAGPGTGKTQTLVGRVEYLLNRGVDAEKILILTFSNKAAAELSERIAAKHPAAAAKIWSGTFHSFGLDIIRRFHHLLDLPPDPRLIDRSDAIELLEHEYPSLKLERFKNLWDPSDTLGNILSAISRAKDEVADEVAYRARAEAMFQLASGPEEQEAAARCLEVATVFGAYERLKRESRCIDLGDLVAMPVRLCETHPHVRAHLAACYQHVLVDEYQDVNRSSVRLLRAIAGDGRNLWVVGDVKQSIYRFRGASAYNMARFDREDFPGAQRGRLTTNYRSHQEVIDAFLTFATDIPSVKGTDISLTAHRGASGRMPAYQSVETDDQEIVAVAEAIEQMRAEGYSYRDQAVLSAGNERLGRFAEGLERLGIPVLYLGSLFERDEVKDLLSLLSLLVDGRAMGLVRVAAMDGYRVSLADVAYVLAHLRQLDSEPLEWISIVNTLEGLSAEGRDGLRRIASLLSGFGQLSHPWTVLTSVLFDRSRIAADIARAPDVLGRAKGVAIWQFMNFLRVQPKGAGLPITRLLDRIRRLVRNADDRDLRQLPGSAQGIDAVRLMTMHGSKGLEFPVVHIPGLTKASIPRSPKSALARDIVPPDGLIEGAGGKALAAMHAASAEEQECLFFVALSRARDRLLLYSPTKTSDGKNRPRSPFVDRLGPHVSKRHSIPTLCLPPDPVDSPVALTIDGVFRFTDHQLGLYQRCPRRFLYTHILEVGGRRTETAFMLLHVAVQKVADAAAARTGQSPTYAELELELTNVWVAHGPAAHGYADEYKRIASELLHFLAETVVGRETRAVPQLRLAVTGGEIVITPDQVVSDTAGNVTMRRVKTGHNVDNDEDGLAAAAFRMAATNHTPGCTVEFIHLGDAAVAPVEMSQKVLGNRRASIDEMVSAVRRGGFSLKETVTCPRCPAFFICGPLPAGPLIKKFSA
jgi:superfamily I DNA/RNA helicase